MKPLSEPRKKWEEIDWRSGQFLVLDEDKYLRKYSKRNILLEHNALIEIANALAGMNPDAVDGAIYEMKSAEQTIRNLGNAELAGEAQDIALNAAKRLRAALRKLKEE